VPSWSGAERLPGPYGRAAAPGAGWRTAPGAPSSPLPQPGTTGPEVLADRSATCLIGRLPTARSCSHDGIPPEWAGGARLARCENIGTWPGAGPVRRNAANLIAVPRRSSCTTTPRWRRKALGTCSTATRDRRNPSPWRHAGPLDRRGASGRARADRPRPPPAELIRTAWDGLPPEDAGGGCTGRHPLTCRPGPRPKGSQDSGPRFTEPPGFSGPSFRVRARRPQPWWGIRGGGNHLGPPRRTGPRPWSPVVRVARGSKGGCDATWRPGVADVQEHLSLNRGVKALVERRSLHGTVGRPGARRGQPVSSDPLADLQRNHRQVPLLSAP